MQGARYIKPENDQNGRAITRPQHYQCYDLRRHQLLNLKAAGLRVKLGATKRDFIGAAEAAFESGGLLSVLTHFEASRRLEFTDGYLDISEIATLRRPSGSGLLHLSVCRGADNLKAIKLSLGSSVWACAPFEKLSASAALLYMVEFWTGITGASQTLSKHLENAQKNITDAGLLAGSRYRYKNVT